MNRATFFGGGLNASDSLSSYWIHQNEARALFDGIDKLPDVCVNKRVYNKKPGYTTEYLLVNGNKGSYTFQVPNTADYIAADTDYIWFRVDGVQRTVTEAELVGYDLQRTPAKYLDNAPNTLEIIMILSSAVIGAKRDRMFRDFHLPVLWDNSLNAYGHVKSNRVTQSLWYEMILTSTGTGAGVSTLKMQVSSDITLTLGANAKFYSDAAGTANESATWDITSGALRTIYLKCNGTAEMKFSDVTKVTKWGDAGVDGWVSSTNAARISMNTTKLINLTVLRITGSAVLNGGLPTGLTYLYLGASIAWTYSGALPVGLTYFFIDSASIAWTYSGALPVGLTNINITGASIAWTYNGALPTGLTFLYILGASIAWTGLDLSGTGNLTALSLVNYRITKMSSADMITLLTTLKNRVGNLPATITINDYADFASPPAGVVTAVNELKAAKSITTVNLGA